jgi:hypothetical protein
MIGLVELTYLLVLWCSMLGKLITPHNILSITVSNSISTVTYEIPPCEFDGINWVNTVPEQFEDTTLQQAIIEVLPYWTTDIKNSYKSEFLNTYTPRPQVAVIPLKYYEIEAALNELINNDQNIK